MRVLHRRMPLAEVALGTGRLISRWVAVW
jgi:hypothetical protein